jgi:hypothetical protein
LGRLKQLGQ